MKDSWRVWCGRVGWGGQGVVEVAKLHVAASCLAFHGMRRWTGILADTCRSTTRRRHRQQPHLPPPLFTALVHESQPWRAYRYVSRSRSKTAGVDLFRACCLISGSKAHCKSILGTTSNRRHCHGRIDCGSQEGIEEEDQAHLEGFA